MNPANVRKCLDQLSAAKSALFNGNVIRSERLTGELGEYLALLQLGGHLATATSNKGWDLITTISGKKDQKVQVKAHAKGRSNTARWSEFTTISAFDYLFIVVFSPNYYVRELYLVDSASLSKLAKFNKTTSRWIVYWDHLKSASKTILPNAGVVGCFGSSVSMPKNILDTQPDPSEDGLPPWELLTGPTAGQLFFAPTAWRSWNVTPSVGVFKTYRYLVFEYRSPKMGTASAINKITLRGLNGKAKLPGSLNANLVAAVIKYGWKRPAKRRPSVNTKGYTAWYANNTLPNHKQAPQYPTKGFDTEQSVFDWLLDWDHLIGTFPPSPSRLWAFIMEVKP
jgi:hypothetical protein